MKHTVVEDALCERAALYALGALNQHEARAFEEHIEEGCAVCEAELLPFESVASILGFAAPEAEPPQGVREKLLARLAEEDVDDGRTVFPTELPPQVDMSQFLIVRSNEGEWRKASEGIFIKQLFADKNKGTVTSLYKLLPGAHIPTHRHLGAEECYIIAGDFHTSEGVLGPGDYTCAMKDSVHPALYSQNGALLLIVSHEGYEFLAHP
jgi:anti-sigma factor ChrR (cupin superfamily)